jgi:hypothetical protein
LGPETPYIKESFTITPVFPEEMPKRKPLNIFARFSQAPGIYSNDGYINLSEWFVLSDKDGRSFTIDGKKQIRLPVQGLDLELKARFPDDALKVLASVKGNQIITGSLEIGSLKSQGSVDIPININIRIPSFELINVSTDHSMWWNRKHDYVFPLGSVLTDYQNITQFSVIMPRYLRITNGPESYLNRHIAELKLVNENGESITGDISGDNVIYPDMPLSREQMTLFMKVLPLEEGSQCLWSLGSQAVSVTFQSDFGTFHQQYSIWTLGEPFYSFTYFPALSLYGSDLAKWLMIIFLSLLLLKMIKYFTTVISQQQYHSGREFVVPIPATIGMGSNASFDLPGHSSDVDGQILGKINKSHRQLFLTGTGTGLMMNSSPLNKGMKPLKTGDIIYLGSDQDDESAVWGLEVIDIEPTFREIEFEIIESPYQRNIISAAVIATLPLIIWGIFYQLLSTESFAAFVHRFNVVNMVYLKTIIPFFS